MRPKSKKLISGYIIFTNSGLDNAIYFAPNIAVEGSFVTFEPQYEMAKRGRSKLEGSKLTLPERVSKEIIYQEIDERLFKPKKQKKP